MTRALTRVSVVAGDVGRQAPLLDYLARTGLSVVEELDGDVVLVLGADRLSDASEDRLLSMSVPVLVVGPTMSTALTDAVGLVPGDLTPFHEIRVRPGPAAADVAARLGGELVVIDRLPVQDKVADDVEVLLTATVHSRAHPVASWRPSTGLAVLTVGSTEATYADPAWQRVVHRILRRIVGETDGPSVRIGMLGYGAIGDEHSAAIAQTDGLELRAVCDPNPLRVAAARELAPAIRAVDDLLIQDDIDLVVVSTPPNTHVDWVLRCLDAGKSVVVEKPFCLTVEEADRQIAAAADRGLTLAVYQNRRWDPDYLAMKRVVRSGQLGEVFHYESFIGGFSHPCNYWHSDETVSGGAVYDWGSHYLDWALDLFPQSVEWVSATAHKRVWHDVSNADHTRVLLHFADGAEAEFTHSDLAAALKPKFYVLGTEGGLIGDWRQERVVSRSQIGTLLEDRLAVSDSPAALRLFSPDGAGGTSETALSVPAAPAQPFHRQLADQLLSGEPMELSPEGSRRTVAVMQAATLSARAGGHPVLLPA
jgi:predicted dehydrogenase